MPPAATKFHNKTANYAYLLDTTPSARSNLDPPQHKPAALTGDVHAKIWPTYNKISKEFDGKILEKSDSDLEVLLIFVSLVDSDRTDTICRPLCSLQSSQVFSSSPSTNWHRIINSSRPCSFISFSMAVTQASKTHSIQLFHSGPPSSRSRSISSG